MKRKQFVLSQSKLHFRRWRNKGYAAFCSCSRVTHIGRLTVAMLSWIGDAIQHVNLIFKRSNDSNGESSEDEDDISDGFFIFEDNYILPMINILLGTNRCCSSFPTFYEIINNLYKLGLLSLR